MKSPSKILERNLLKTHKNIIAVDEVGMGSLAGPVVVCAVMFGRGFFKKPHRELSGVRDSKSLSPRQRTGLASKITGQKGIKYQIAYCYPKTIDKKNIYQAARLAMRRAVNKLVYNCEFIVSGKKTKSLKTANYKLKTVILVDGPFKIPGINLEQIPIVKGDRKVFSIDCASIIAKVFRDKMMVNYAKKYPNYGFEEHKGYGTKRHAAKLAIFGPSKIHRKSFEPVAQLL